MNKLELFTGNVNTATLKRKELNGKTYLVGPIIMAREIVMNKLMYPASELKTSVPHWNGCPVVLGHPKDEDGAHISANSPDVLEEVGVGLIFNTSVDAQNRLRAECWIDMDSLDKNEAFKKLIEDGEVIEVSTGLFTVHEKKTGKFKGRNYEAIARNYKPDHLAILIGETGACSVEDGAGFPRVNAKELMEVNSLSGGDLYAMLAKAVRVSFKGTDGSWPYYIDSVDDSVIFERYNSALGSYDTFKVAYTLSEDETKVSFSGTPKKVLVRKTYVDDPDTNVIQQNQQTAGDATSSEINGEKLMTQKEIVAKMLSDKKIDANTAKVLEGMSQEQFDVYQKGAPSVPHAPKATLPSTESNAEGVEGEEDEEDGVQEVNRKGKKTVVAKKEVPAVNELDAEAMDWAKGKFTTEKATFIETILGNKSNAFTKDELETMGINTLEKMSKIAEVKTTDMAGVGAQGGSPDANAKKTAPKVKPYVPTM